MGGEEGEKAGFDADRTGLDDVVADGDEGAVVEQRDEHKHENGQLGEAGTGTGVSVGRGTNEKRGWGRLKSEQSGDARSLRVRLCPERGWERSEIDR